MDERDSSQTIFLSGPSGLAKILDQNQEDSALWGAGEMHAMWLHQLGAPVDADLGTMASANLSALRQNIETQGFLEKSFANLLQSEKPPLPLLKTIKDFAKQTFKEAEDAQFKEIAAALYYATYAAGLLYHHQRLGGMKRRELIGGFDWALGRSWIDDATKKLISQARPFLKP